MKTFNQLFGMAIIAVLLVSCTGKKEKAAVKEELPFVRIQNVYEEEVPQISEYTATVEAFKTNDISSSTGSRIKRILVDVGSHVRAGQAVVILDDASIEQQRIRMANQHRDLQRAEELLRIGGGTQQSVDQLRTEYNANARALRTLKENTVLTSPISGIVSAKNYFNGDLPSALPILVIEQMQPVKVIVNVSEEEFPKVKQGMPVTVKLDVYNDETFNGRVYLIHPAIDASTRTFQVEVTISNSDNRVRPGMFARVAFNYGSKPNVVVPDMAIQKQTGSDVRYVYVYQPNGTVKFCAVKLGRRLGNRYELLSGVASNSQVVVNGQSRLTNGAKVQVQH